MFTLVCVCQCNHFIHSNYVISIQSWWYAHVNSRKISHASNENTFWSIDKMTASTTWNTYGIFIIDNQSGCFAFLFVKWLPFHSSFFVEKYRFDDKSKITNRLKWNLWHKLNQMYFEWARLRVVCVFYILHQQGYATFVKPSLRYSQSHLWRTASFHHCSNKMTHYFLIAEQTKKLAMVMRVFIFFCIRQTHRGISYSSSRSWLSGWANRYPSLGVIR